MLPEGALYSSPINSYVPCPVGCKSPLAPSLCGALGCSFGVCTCRGWWVRCGGCRYGGFSVRLLLAIMKCRNPANPFTIARFHYGEGSREVTKNKRGEKRIYLPFYTYIPFQRSPNLPIASMYLSVYYYASTIVWFLHNADLDALL